MILEVHVHMDLGLESWVVSRKCRVLILFVSFPISCSRQSSSYFYTPKFGVILLSPGSNREGKDFSQDRCGFWGACFRVTTVSQEALSRQVTVEMGCDKEMRSGEFQPNNPDARVPRCSWVGFPAPAPGPSASQETVDCCHARGSCRSNSHLLTLVWLSPSCCRHLESKPAIGNSARLSHHKEEF